jgi:hypothetical protein
MRALRSNGGNMTTEKLLSSVVRADAPLPRDGLHDPDALFTRASLAAELIRAGIPISPATLATKATRGGGPPYRLFGRRPLYRWGDALEWANGLLSVPVANTSEAHLAKERDAKIGKVA